MKNIIYKKIKSKINIFYLKIYDDTNKHILKNNTKKHFRIIIVSEVFHNISLLNRHKKIYAIVRRYIPEKIYSLQINTYSVQEWISLSSNISKAISCSQKTNNSHLK